MSNTSQTVAKYLADNVDWNKFFSLIDTIGNSLNGAKYRFLKSDLIEKSLELYSKNSEIKYVNENGVDHLLPVINTNLEMKYSGKSLHTTKKQLKKNISAIRLVNTNGDYIPNKLPDTYADFLIVADYFGAMIIDKETLKKYLFFGKGFIEARNVPTNEGVVVVGPQNNIVRKANGTLNLKDEFDKWQANIINQIA